MYFVLKNNEIVSAHADEYTARREYDALIGQGWAATRSASIYRADSRQQMEDHLAKRVQLVCAGTGRGYWESPEGKAQQERDEAFERATDEAWS